MVKHGLPMTGHQDQIAEIMSISHSPGGRSERKAQVAVQRSELAQAGFSRAEGLSVQDRPHPALQLFREGLRGKGDRLDPDQPALGPVVTRSNLSLG